MRLLRLPGMHRPCSDTWLLADEDLAGGRVLDLCTGTGALAMVAAGRAGASVTAVDLTRRAVTCARVNARVHRLQVDVRRGDLLATVAGERFDAILSNPPYVPAATEALPRHRAAAALDGGRDGRALIDRICRQAPAHLHPGGAVPPG